jgi:hypothetical protein
LLLLLPTLLPLLSLMDQGAFLERAEGQRDWSSAVTAAAAAVVLAEP